MLCIFDRILMMVRELNSGKRGFFFIGKSWACLIGANDGKLLWIIEGSPAYNFRLGIRLEYGAFCIS